MKKLTENHPLYKKVQLLEKKMDEMKVSISAIGNIMFITDHETQTCVRYQDADDGSDISEFPYGLEIKLQLVE